MRDDAIKPPFPPRAPRPFTLPAELLGAFDGDLQFLGASELPAVAQGEGLRTLADLVEGEGLRELAARAARSRRELGAKV